MTAQIKIKEVKKTLRKVFHLETLRPHQSKIINLVLVGKNVLAIMPTGAGKSLCYQLPSMHLEGMTVIVSPLISLMKDQVDKLEEIGLDAAQLNSAIPQSEETEALEKIEDEDSDFIFITPERATNQGFLETLRNKTVALFVIDEAHCISQWGHDFRPAFLGLSKTIKQLGKPKVLALTATATGEVIEDIKKQLDLPDMEIVNGGIFRGNLHFEVLHVTDELQKRQNLIRFLNETEGAKIIYAATVKTVGEISEFLKQAGIEAVVYHGKLSARERRETQDKFLEGEVQTMIATNAFGMGVDKPDIRAVIHYQIPGNLEAYYQEAGRAGRDGKPARCLLLYDVHDRRTQQFFLGGRYPKADDILAIYQSLQTMGANETAADLTQIQETAVGVAKSKVRVTMSLLKEMKIVREVRGAKFKLIKTDLREAEIEELAQQYEDKGEKDRKKLEQMMLYAQSALCRWQILSEYFEEKSDKCDVCDNCANPIERRLEISVPESVSQIELPVEKQDEIEFQTGDIVQLPKHGEAKVKEVDGENVTVVLENGESKVFKKEFISPV